MPGLTGKILCAGVATLCSAAAKRNVVTALGQSGQPSRAEIIVSLGGHQYETDTTSRISGSCRYHGRAAALIAAGQGGRTARRQAGAKLLSLQGRRYPGHRCFRRQEYLQA